MEKNKTKVDPNEVLKGIVPKEFKLGGIKIPVILNPNLQLILYKGKNTDAINSNDELLGLSTYVPKKKIDIAVGCEGAPLDIKDIQRTFYHELFHHFLSEIHYSFDTTNEMEMVVEGMAKCMQEYLNTVKF